MSNPKTTAVVVTNRPDSFTEFVTRWRHADGTYPWDQFVLVEDSKTRLFSDEQIRSFGISHHLPESKISELVSGYRIEGPIPGFVSSRDSARKAIGFVAAAAWTKPSHILVLDDDCYPVEQINPIGPTSRRQFVAGHLSAMTPKAHWVSTVEGRHIRGVPYGVFAPGDPGPGSLRVVANMGLWRNVPDDDSPHTLVQPEIGVRFPDGAKTRVMPINRYWPMSGMNLMFDVVALPLFYFPRMGEGVPYARFDDIWCGVIVQKICRHLGWSITAGAPEIHHARASNPMVNLVKEAPGIAANEYFWRVIDEIHLTAKTPSSCMQEVADFLKQGSYPCAAYLPAPLPGYLENLGGWIEDWLRFLDRHKLRN
jgi:reversibly glycosylated polypeptide/UDP-arabinopyranose mutase